MNVKLKGNVDMLYRLERQKLCDWMLVMYDRWLTNAAGGNVTVKVNDDHWIMTPTLMAQEKLCRLVPENILVVDKDLNIIEGDGNLTRETNMHMAIYETDPRVKAIIHAHPKEIMPFATMGITMPIINENLRKMGDLPCLEYAPATTVILAERVRDFVKSKVEANTALPYGAMLQEHGIILAETSLEKCYDILERLEANAYTYIQARVLEMTGHKWNAVTRNHISDE